MPADGIQSYGLKYSLAASGMASSTVHHGFDSPRRHGFDSQRRHGFAIAGSLKMAKVGLSPAFNG